MSHLYLLQLQPVTLTSLRMVSACTTPLLSQMPTDVGLAVSAPAIDTSQCLNFKPLVSAVGCPSVVHLRPLSSCTSPSAYLLSFLPDSLLMIIHISSRFSLHSFVSFHSSCVCSVYLQHLTFLTISFNSKRQPLETITNLESLFGQTADGRHPIPEQQFALLVTQWLSFMALDRESSPFFP